MATVVAELVSTKHISMLSQRGALKLETLGMRHSRGSMHVIVKQAYGFRGTKESVLQQLEDLIERHGQYYLAKRYTPRREKYYLAWFDGGGDANGASRKQSLRS